MEEETESAWYPMMTEKHFEHAIQDAIRAEREACAKLCASMWYEDGQHTADVFAKAIRERSNA